MLSISKLWLCLLAVLSLYLSACDQQPPATTATSETSTLEPEHEFWEGGGPNSTFYDMARHLDAEGDLYQYSDIDTTMVQVARDAKRENLEVFLAEAYPEGIPESLTIENLLDLSGFSNVRAIGSSGARQGDLYRIRNCTLLSGEPAGLLRMLALPPEKDALAAAPADTLLFVHTRMDMRPLWEFLNGFIEMADHPELTRWWEVEVLQKLQDQFELTVDEILAETTGSYTIFADLDATTTWTVPSNGPTQYSMPMPRVALSFGVKSDRLLKWIELHDQGPDKSERIEKNGVVYLLDNVPHDGFDPVFAFHDNTITIASHMAYADSLIAQAGAGDGGLADSEKYRRLAAGLPSEATMHFFASKKLGDEAARWLRWEEARKPGRFRAQPLLDLAAQFLHGAAGTMAYTDNMFLKTIQRPAVEEGTLIPGLSPGIFENYLPPLITHTILAVVGTMPTEEASEAGRP